jgi:hypothetical protein
LLKKKASETVLMLFLISITSFTLDIPLVRAEHLIGVKVGDWIKYDYAATSALSGTAIPTWMKVEILAVEGMNITLRSTLHLSNETEDSETFTLDVHPREYSTRGGYWLYYPLQTLDTLFGWCFIITANPTVGVDEIYIKLVLPLPVQIGGNLTGEISRTYAGTSRTVVYFTWPGYLGGRYGSQPLKYYWDKQTGVLVEASVTIDGVPVTAKATETNMWQAQSLGLPIDQTYLFILVAVVIAIAVGSIAFVMRRKKKPPEVVTPTAQIF